MSATTTHPQRSELPVESGSYITIPLPRPEDEEGECPTRRIMLQGLLWGEIRRVAEEFEHDGTNPFPYFLEFKDGHGFVNRGAQLGAFAKALEIVYDLRAESVTLPFGPEGFREACLGVTKGCYEDLADLRPDLDESERAHLVAGDARVLASQFGAGGDENER